MEVIELPGYTGEEKIHIARKYLIPKQAAEHGIKEGEQLEFTEEGLKEIIHSFTREAGRPQSRTRNRYTSPQTGAQNCGRQDGEDGRHTRGGSRIPRCAEVPHRT